MSQKTMQLEIVSAQTELFSGAVSLLIATGDMGDLGIHPGHTALLTQLAPGQIEVTLADGEQQYFYVSGGMLEVQPDVVTVLADTGLRAQDLDEAAALAAKEAAERQMAEKKSEMEFSTAMTELAEAAAQLKTIQSLRKARR